MSQNRISVDKICETEDRKRRFERSCEEEDHKKPKLSTSLGLSLLQAYDEEEPSSEDEDESITFNEVCLKSADSTSIRDANTSAVDNDSSDYTAEEEKGIDLNTLDVQINKADRISTDELSIGDDDVNLQHGKINVNKLNESDPGGSSEKLKTDLSEAVPKPDLSHIPSNKLDDILFRETLTRETERKTSELIRPDYNFSVFGTDLNSTDFIVNELKVTNVNSIDLAEKDSKPTKKVKLNRSKFVRSADESSNETKTTSTMSTTPIMDQVSSVTFIKHVEETSFESVNSINNLSSAILTEGSQIGGLVELNDEAAQKIDATGESVDGTSCHSFSKETVSNNDTALLQQSQNDFEAFVPKGQEESVHFISTLKENMDNESTNKLQENLQTSESVSETIALQENLELHSSIESVKDKKLPENKSLKGDINTATEDVLPHPTLTQSIVANAEEMAHVSKDENGDVKITSSVADNNEVKEISTLEVDNKEVDIAVSEFDNKSTDLEVTNKPEEDWQKLEIVNNETSVKENIYKDTIKPVVKSEDETKEPFLVEVTNQLEQDHTICDEEIFEDAVKINETVQNQMIQKVSESMFKDAVEMNETVQETSESTSEDAVKINVTVQNQMIQEISEHLFENAVEINEIVQNQIIQETPESIIPSKHLEISKLEQALTGRLECSQSHPKTPSNQVPAKKGRPQKVKTAVEDAKQNIKLHISVQGDRVSIKNTQSTLETPSLPPVRVKRQYRKRARVPGELEAQQASAKEYTHRLRQRTERETPGAKKRTRKKKNQEPESPESKTEPSFNSSSADTSEKVQPLTVAINELPSQKRNIAGKVQPIKLKISKNANATIKCTSQYDVCLASEVDNRNMTNIIEKMSGTLEEACKKEEPLSNSIEKVSTSWLDPDLQRVERLLKESDVTITPLTIGKDIFPSSTPVLQPTLNSQEKFKIQTIPSADTEPTPAPSLTPVSESDENSKNLTISLKADADERNSPWKIVKSPHSETATLSVSSDVILSKPIDVKSEIRKKIALVEKRKHNVNALEIEPICEPSPKTDTSTVDPPSSSQPDPVQEDDRPTRPMDINAIMNESAPLEPSTVSVSTIHKAPSTATITPTKLPRLPADLFPKKRGRPTKAMVAAREAYWQQQEKMEKSKRGDETDGSSDVCISTPTTEPVKIVKRGRKMKNERFEKKDSDDLSYEELPYDPTREAEEQKRVQEERMKKEEERERKNELRRLRAKERSDVIKAKRLRQKMKAKERHKMAKELRRLQQEEKKKLEEQLKRLPVSMSFDDETRMSAENSQAANISFSAGLVDDDSSGATNDLSQKLKKSRMEVTDPDSKDLMVDQIAEYQWPIQGGDLYMIQEQVSNFLGVKSFKRKYPDIWRRPVDSEERAYLVDSGLVSETLCDLGITAVRSSEVLDIMCSDFPEKYEEFRRYMREKQMKELSFKQRAWANGLGYKLLMADGSKQDMKKRAMESVSNWNSALNKSRVDDRRCHMDLQTFIIHYPKQRGARMTLPSPSIGSYPVTILPGQFCDFYKEYTPTELRYLPINTVLYGPLKNPTLAQNDYASQTDSDDSSSSDDSSTTSEDTQATEETVEDLDSSMVLDGNNLKFEFKDSTFVGDEEQTLKEMNGDRDPLTENDTSRVLCKICLGDEFRNKMNVPEVLISCSQCASANHPTCLDLSLNIVPRIKSYAWQCPDCKICAQCKENADEDKMLFCDTCDQGYHIYCVGLIKVPAGNWQCKECSRLKENNGSIVDTAAVRKEYVPFKKESDVHLVVGMTD